MRNLVLFLVIFSLNGCSYFDEKEDHTKKWNADRLYAEAKGNLDAGNYPQAVEFYQRLEARYPFGKHAQQALLDLAYGYYKSEEHDASIGACNRFIKLYPQNLHVDYAYYLKGLANFNKGKASLHRFIPNEISDESQRDPGAAFESFQNFSELIKRFPDSEYIEDAEQRMRHLRNNLAENEIHIANYYMRRGAFIAAANRARYVIENYDRTPVMPEALVIIAKAYRVLEMDDLANDALRVLEMNYPNHPGIYEIEELEVK
jgi:outer membrane protein assembly factor BamD|tara:strand:- start:1179 stop:1958 length:780 start_codon:yes stop_codon:yes gene_type:complete